MNMNTSANRCIAIGTLINIDEGDRIVKLDADLALKTISLNADGQVCTYLITEL